MIEHNGRWYDDAEHRDAVLTDSDEAREFLQRRAERIEADRINAAAEAVKAGDIAIDLAEPEKPIIPAPTDPKGGDAGPPAQATAPEPGGGLTGSRWPA